MTDFNWCHGPRCHERETTTRVRGVKGHKVLRTRKIQADRDWDSPYKHWDYFCDQTCLFDYIRANTRELVAIAPCTEAKETPIEVEKEKYESYRYNWTDSGSERIPYQATRITIKPIDNA